ncbi:DNA repair protein RecO [bacterium]|jgi:DNA repair protein RecO|nr:DNA repair protein RecO [bacterium]
MKENKISGIILKSTPIFEHDKQIELYSETHGKCRFIAKRVHKKGSFVGRLEPLNHVSICSFKGKSFLYINQCDVIDFFPKIREDFNRLSLALFCIDIIRKSTVYDQDNPALFSILHAALKDINEEINLQTVQTNFQNHILISEGVKDPYSMNNSTNDFTAIFEAYSGHRVTQPIFL